MKIAGVVVVYNPDENVNNKLAKSLVEAMLKTTNNMSEIARNLNDNGFLTSKGCKFSAIQVIRLINRYKINLLD